MLFLRISVLVLDYRWLKPKEREGFEWINTSDTTQLHEVTVWSFVEMKQKMNVQNGKLIHFWTNIIINLCGKYGLISVADGSIFFLVKIHNLTNFEPLIANMGKNSKNLDCISLGNMIHYDIVTLFKNKSVNTKKYNEKWGHRLCKNLIDLKIRNQGRPEIRPVFVEEATKLGIANTNTSVRNSKFIVSTFLVNLRLIPDNSYFMNCSNPVTSRTKTKSSK